MTERLHIEFINPTPVLRELFNVGKNNMSRETFAVNAKTLLEFDTADEAST